MRRGLFFGLVGLGALGLVLMPACGGGGVQLAEIPGADGGPDGPGGGALPKGVGEPCALPAECRPGLACTSGTCQPGRSSEEGTSCVISAECKDGLYCGPERKCAKAGAGDSGASCSSDGDCKSGLRCNIVGFSTQCQPEGNKDVGGACNVAGDCFGGLVCADKICIAPPPGPPPLAIPGFKGVLCEDETALGVTAHFRVPRANPDDKDFFRLPFPNDIRRVGGKLNLSNFPTPGSDLLGFDLVDRWARYLEQTGAGWSAYPTVTFRFSGEIDFESLKVAGATRYVDLTDQTDIGHGWSGTTGRTAYVCPHHLSFRPQTGVPLKQGHTYAVLMTNAAKAKGGGAITVSEDLKAVMGPTAPADPTLAAAHAAYAPLRTWAAAKSVDLNGVINASVFTVGKHDDIATKLPAAIDSLPAIASTGWVKCGSGPSPCPGATGDRACPAAPDAAFSEYHGLITLPLFQKGTLPFLEPADGGDIEVVGGAPTTSGRTVQVCAALTIPTAATFQLSAAPVVIYAHGTGGSFRSHITEGVAARLAAESKPMAVLGIDQVGHGTRRGASTADPSTIFFNFANPAAARGNVLQGAADQMALARFLSSFTFGQGFAGSGAVSRVAFWGHSQGATEGAIAMPYVSATRVAGVLFSGVGGSLIDSLLTKKSPVNLAAVAPAVLSEAPANVNGAHPVLSMFQNAIDPADPLDHAGAILTGNQKHVFVVYGQADTYSPPATEQAYITAANLPIAQHPASVTAPDNLGRAPVAVPLSNNVNGVTAGVRQYSPSGYDGHFVVFRNDTAKADANRFLNGVATVVPPPAIGP